MAVNSFKTACLSTAILLCSATSFADNTPGQTLQINTRFHRVLGTPTWTLILRDVTTGVVMPYVFDIHHTDNYWIAFSYGHSYRVTASSMKFGPLNTINNFCRLEGGIMTGTSMYVTLTGDLTTNRTTSKCTVLHYNDPH